MAIGGTTLVTGGTGKTGRRVVERLAALGRPVRIGSRTAERPLDWEHPSTWSAVLDGIDAVYLSYYPDVAMPGAADVVGAFVDLAQRQGVRRVVLLSGRGEEEAERAEEVVRAADIEWTIVRSSWFAQNFSENFLLDPILAGEIVLPSGTAAEPFIDANDIADVAVAALTDDGHAGRLYEVTGPRLLTFADAIGEIAEATGREIRYAEVTPDDYAAGLRAAGVPGDYVWLIHYLFTTVLDGRNESLADGVQQALGRAPRDFRDYAREAAASGVWNPQPAGALR
jgi:uncharacterized protein YbjT (DUF2867 family)